MWFARYFPGLNVDAESLGAMTPEETRAMRKAGEKMLRGEIDERFAHTKIIAAAGGLRMR